MAHKLSPTAMRILKTAADRERGNICPTGHTAVTGIAQSAIINALERRGLIAHDGIWTITDAGRALVETERTWEISDIDGSNKRTVTLAQFLADNEAKKAKASTIYASALRSVKS